jgi:hypothetical protein
MWFKPSKNWYKPKKTNGILVFLIFQENQKTWFKPKKPVFFVFLLSAGNQQLPDR